MEDKTTELSLLDKKFLFLNKLPDGSLDKNMVVGQMYNKELTCST